MKLLIVSAVLSALAFLASAQVYSYCDLTPPLSDEDPDVILESHLAAGRFAYPRDQVQQALSRDRAASAFIQAQSLARNATAQQTPQRNPSRARERSPNGRKYSAPEAYESLCNEEAVRIVGKFVSAGEGKEAEFCHVVADQALQATICGNLECSVHNPFPFYNKYYCLPDSYVYESAMVYCPDRNSLEFETFKIPIQCVCKKVHCNLDGMNI